MNRTYTPDLAPEVLDRLASYADRFRDDFNRPRQAQYSGVYLQGLILDGDRKSIEPMSRKVTLPAGLVVKLTSTRPSSSSSARVPGTSGPSGSDTARPWPTPSPRPRGSS